MQSHFIVLNCNAYIMMEWYNNSLLRLPAAGEGSGSSPGFDRLLCLSVVIQKPVSLLIYSVCGE